jgi:cellulose synthase/poly-beta-1,6-N-acetylglucosamine synthase-like glycosyltransferase
MVHDFPKQPLELSPRMRWFPKWNLNGRIESTRCKVPLDADGPLLDRIGVERSLCAGLVPIRRMGALTLVAADPQRGGHGELARLEASLGALSVVHAPLAEVRRSIETARAPALARLCETRTPAPLSCRDWSGRRVTFWLVLTLSLIAAAAVFAPGALVLAAAFWATLTLLSLTVLRAAAAFVEARDARRLSVGWKSTRDHHLAEADLPRISLLIPLFQERDMAGHLLGHLGRLDYPRDKLEILLILEAGDHTTETAIQAVRLPPEISLVRVPRGQLQTKPRALNYALDFARGDIIGIYDAEDAPAADQLLRVAETFARADPDVACLQGVLDFYNWRQTWLTRAFTIDYATWFRLVLPGLVKMGLPIPLGGTTVFLRRDALENVGRWDAHNVTEDADLGLRLARMGYRTRFVASVTQEEATPRVRPWIRQRSRWIKGYAVTWAVHMRNPMRLWRELGGRGFLTVQILFLGTLSQFILAPLLWSFWVVPFGLPHPVMSVLPREAVYALAAIFFASEIVTLAIAAFSVATPTHRGLIWWVPLMHLYWPLAAVASWKSFAELITRPFFWDKTNHGSSLVAAEIADA